MSSVGPLDMSKKSWDWCISPPRRAMGLKLSLCARKSLLAHSVHLVLPNSATSPPLVWSPKQQRGQTNALRFSPDLHHALGVVYRAYVRGFRVMPHRRAEISTILQTNACVARAYPTPTLDTVEIFSNWALGQISRECVDGSG